MDSLKLSWTKISSKLTGKYLKFIFSPWKRQLSAYYIDTLCLIDKTKKNCFYRTFAKIELPSASKNWARLESFSFEVVRARAAKVAKSLFCANFGIFVCRKFTKLEKFSSADPDINFERKNFEASKKFFKAKMVLSSALSNSDSKLKNKLATLVKPHSSSDPESLASYIHALISKSKSRDELHEICVKKLELFFQSRNSNNLGYWSKITICGNKVFGGIRAFK